MNKVNVEGTANVVNLSLHFGVKHLVHVSSIAALGRNGKRTHLDEKSKWEESKHNSRYAQSKFQAEMEVQRGIAEGLPVSIVNPSVVIGRQRWDRGVAAFFKKMDEGLKFCPSGSSGFVDVEDVARFIGLLLENGPTYQRCILNGTNCGHRALFAEIARHLGVPEPPITVGPFLVGLAWRVEWLKEKIFGTVPLVTRESARAGVSHFSYANEKSRSMFGFEYTPLSESIRRMAEAYKGECRSLVKMSN
jgi:Nucleoside-diphosphate-sugar epimerases